MITERASLPLNVKGGGDIHKCPVCKGTGKVYLSAGYHTVGNPCHGCAPWGSLGWIKA
jgi:hypothetical protein